MQTPIKLLATLALMAVTPVAAKDLVLYSNAVDDTYLAAGTPDRVGDQILWNSPLEQTDGTVVGTNAGQCVRVDAPGNFVCTMTLDHDGAGKVVFAGVQVVEPGVSELMITGGTGVYAGARGVILSKPVENRARFEFAITFLIKIARIY